MMTKRILLLAAALFAAVPLTGESPEVVCYNFDKLEDFERDWSYYSFLSIARNTEFHLTQRPHTVDGHALTIDANNSSGFICTIPQSVDLTKMPIMRWRWRVISNLDLPEGVKDPDDQPGVIYICDGSRIRQHSIGYRWECNTPIGEIRIDHYRGGLTTLKSTCMRNRTTPIGQWVEEERNVLEDFKKAFQRPPSKNFVLCIGANSQNSKSNTRLEIDYIEFRSAPASEK